MRAHTLSRLVIALLSTPSQALMVLVVVTACLRPVPAAAATIHALGDMDPAGEFVIGGVVGSRGWRFEVTEDNLWITELGINTPGGAQNTDRTVTLWDVSSQTILSQTTFDAGSGWLWNSVSPVALTNGSQYLVEYNSSIADYWYSNFASAAWFPTSPIDYLDMRWCNGCSPNTYPTNVLNGYQYGIPDIGYEVRDAQAPVPEPASLTLLGLGLAGMAGRRWRQRKAS